MVIGWWDDPEVVLMICDFTVLGTYILGAGLIETAVKNRPFILIINKRWYKTFIANWGLWTHWSCNRSHTLALAAALEHPWVWGLIGAVSQLPLDRWRNGWMPDFSAFSLQVLCDPAEHYWNSRSCTTHVVKANGFVAEIFRFSVCSCKHPIYLTAVLLFFMTTDLNELPGAVFRRGFLPPVAVFIYALVSLKKSWALKRCDSAQLCRVIYYYCLLRALGITSTWLWNRALLWLALFTNNLKGSPFTNWTVQWEILARDNEMSAEKQDDIVAISDWVSLQLPQLKTEDF